MAETTWRPDRRQWWLLGAALLIVSLPHLCRLPWSLVAVWCLLAGARVAYGVRGLGWVPSWLRLPIALLIVILVFHHFGLRLGREAATTLLVMMTALKFLELQRRRDAQVLVFVGFFLLAAAFLESQSLAMGVWLPAAFLSLVAAWLSLEQLPGVCRCRTLMRQSVSLGLRALPVALGLFVLFPRLPSPLWQLPESEPGHRTGLGDHMEPGAISELALSPEPVARIRFPDGIPPPALRYFRGPVLELTDGARWERVHKAQSGTRAAETRVAARGPRYRQEILLEPQPRSRVLPAMELVTALPPGARLQADLTLVADRKLDQPRLYRVTSQPESRIVRLSESERLLNLLVPERIGERVRRLARRFRDGAAHPRQIVEAALSYFRREPFHYTLRPSRLDDRDDPVGAFLFETRRGFCEHYASAFAILMRIAGLPARVVTGYQGGEVNPLADHLVLRRADAHAWTEVWVDGEGWIRVDPTAAVAPERIEQPLDPRGLFDDRVRFVADPDGPLGRLIARLHAGWDLMDAAWTRAVAGFDRRRQLDLLERFGLAGLTWQLLATLAVMLLAPLAGLLAIFLIRRWHRERPDPALALYDRFRRLCRRQGLATPANEGPCELLQRVARQRPTMLPEAERFIRDYVALRYGRTRAPAIPALLNRMRQTLRSLR